METEEWEEEKERGGGRGGVHTSTVDFRRFDMRQVSLIANPWQCPVPARTASFARL